MKTTAIDLLLGVAIGDAIGVPYEFHSKIEMKENPAKDMTGFGTHNQPPGTWSDDSSLTFCLAEALLFDYNLKIVAENFIKWKRESFWTARNQVFDIGITTALSISELEKIISEGKNEELALLKEKAKDSDNGNGSLMRILPLVYEIKGKSLKEQFDVVWQNSALTHKHIRAAMSCMIYLKLAENIIGGNNKSEAYEKTKEDILSLWIEIGFNISERKHFDNVIKSDIRQLGISQIKSGGYVIETLESSLWCFLTTKSFKEAVLTAINLGEDTDTTGAVTGGLGGLYYGMNDFPKNWMSKLSRNQDIIELGEKLNSKYVITEL